MEGEEFKRFAGEMADYIVNYMNNIRSRPVTPGPDVQPGYLKSLVRPEPPQEAESWKEIMGDLEPIVMKGVTHWHHPHFFAFFPTARSYPSIVADMLSDAIACIGFSWIGSPVCTELEVCMMEWLIKMLGLPKKFSNRETQGKGGGVIQGTASEATLVTLLAARAKARKEHEVPIEKLVAYCSAHAHSSAERAGLLGAVKIRLISTDEKQRMRGDTLRNAMNADKANGLVPFFVVATLGTTNTCSFDMLEEIGPVCHEFGAWLHIDAAYAGSVFVCEEYRYLMKGIEYAQSFNFNPHKWLQINFDCSALFVSNVKEFTDGFRVDPAYLRHDKDLIIPDYRHWQIPLGRRIRSLKLWFVLRTFGVKKIQEFIREDIEKAKIFEKLMRADPTFEIFSVSLGLVCFRLRNKSNEDNEHLLKAIEERNKIYIVSTVVDKKYILRFCVCARDTTTQDIQFAFNEIQTVAKQLFNN